MWLWVMRSTGGQWRSAAFGKTRREARFGLNFGDDYAPNRQQMALERRRMHSDRQRRMQGNADGAMIRSGLVQQRMQVANRQHHRRQHENDADRDGNSADAGCRCGPHNFYSEMQIDEFLRQSRQNTVYPVEPSLLGFFRRSFGALTFPDPDFNQFFRAPKNLLQRHRGAVEPDRVRRRLQR